MSVSGEASVSVGVSVDGGEVDVVDSVEGGVVDAVVGIVGGVDEVGTDVEDRVDGCFSSGVRHPASVISPIAVPAIARTCRRWRANIRGKNTIYKY